MVSRPTQKSSPAPRSTTMSALSPAPSRSLASSTAMASDAALPISGRLSVISSTGPLRAVRISLAMPLLLESNTPAGEPGVLFDHFVDAHQQGHWHFEAKRSRCLEIDHQLDFDRLLHRQVGRLFTLEDAARIGADKAESIPKTGSVAHQPTSGSEVAIVIDRRNTMACGQCHQLIAPACQERIHLHQQRASTLFNEGCNGFIDFAFGTRFDDEQFL